ncbi:MAG: hypothetical protein ACYTHJ_16245 [Planctomycetota bacterium]|jgi:hypothetical protein
MVESELHLSLKQAAMRWLWDAGYAAMAEEVVVPGVGVVDVAAAGLYRKSNPRSVKFDPEPRIDRHHVVIVECKAYRSDFLRDQGRQMQFAFALEEKRARRKAGRPGKHRYASPALGKFDTCLLRPHANVHYLLTPPRLIKKSEVPRRWGLLVLDHGYVRTLVKPTWFENASTQAMEGAIARALTGDRMFGRRTTHQPPDRLPFSPLPFRIAYR